MSSFAVSYPEQVPFESIKEVVRIVRDGSIRTEAPAFGQHLWIAQGYVQSQVLGAAADQPNVVGSPAGQIKLSQAEALQYLDTIGSFRPDIAGKFTIPWKPLLAWLLKQAAEQLAA